MLTNYIKIAYRVLYRNKFFTILNVIGLALGMSLSLLYIALLSFLHHYDDFHPLGDRVYRVTTQVYDKQENPRYASAPVGIAENLKGFTGVEKVVRIHGSMYGEAIYGDKKIALGGYFADPGFFEMFNFPLLQGNKAKALINPNTIVVSETEARKIFGTKDAVGKTLSMEGYGNFLVTGILKDLPENSHMQFGAIASYATLLSSKGALFLNNKEGWKSFQGSYIYFLLQKNAEPNQIDHFLNQVAKERYANEDVKASFKLQPLHRIVPGPELYDPIGPNWGYLGLFIIGLMTLIVLVPACSNYINLSISQSLERMKEIGVRKVMGSQKRQIFLQFIVESITIVLLALVLSYMAYEVIRKDFLSQMVETSPIDLTPTWLTFSGFLLFALLVGVVAGIVPALYFTKISPIDALKGKEVKTSGRSYFRKIVLTIQFMLSLGFILAIVIMVRQYHYSVNYDLGFEQQHVLDVELNNINPHVFKSEYGKLPTVKSISMSSHILGIGPGAERYIKAANQIDSISASFMSVDEAFIANMKLTMLAGRNFSDSKPGNARLILVNEEFVNKLNLKDPVAAIGKPVAFTDGSVLQIGGVLKNFHYAGLKEIIQPFFFEYDPSKFNYANLKLQSGDVAGSITAMEKLWKEIGGEGKFTAQLFSDEIKDAYSFYKMILKLWGFLGLLAITVTCLGLLGTVSFTTKRRFKEISIRKVMGASSKSLVLLLSKDFIILMVIASSITIPVVYFLFNHLLANTQHYSIQIGFVEIISGLIIMLLLGLLTVLSQTLKAANANPADNLRTE